MRRKIIIAAITLLFVSGVTFLWIESQSRSPSEVNHGEKLEAAQKRSRGAGSQNDRLRIVSDEQTATNRVVTVSKGGVEKRVILPRGVLVTPEDLEALAFDTPQPSGPLPKPQISINSHLYFYGLVVDEKTNALTGALIQASAQVYENGNMRWQKLQLYSEADGRFTVDVPWGQALVLNVSKKPDYINPPERRFKYGMAQDWEIHRPNVAAPVVFVLHRKKPPEPLFAFAHGYTAPHTGEPVRVDLTTGKLVSEGGDLIVSIYHPDPFGAGVRSPWKLAVEVVGGGLVEVPSNPLNYVGLEEMHDAPESGYEKGFAVEYGPDSPTYRRQHEGVFYIKSREGQVYAKIRFDMHTQWDQRGVPFGIRAVVNTNGSINLQNPSLK